MEYNELIRRKNRILCIVLFASILLRCIVNAIFTSVSAILGLGIGGIVLTAIVSLLCWKIKNGRVMMFGMVGVFSALAIACMMMFPCTVNYLMFFLCVFMVVLYEDIVPIAIQCTISIVCMAFFYVRNGKELNSTWSPDALAMSIVYVVTGMFVFTAMCILSRKSFNQLQATLKANEAAKNHDDALMKEITESVTSLGATSAQINENVLVTKDIANQIAIAAEEVANMATEEVTSAEDIRRIVEESVQQILEMKVAGHQMSEASDDTNAVITSSNQQVQQLVTSMGLLNQQMEFTVKEMLRLEENNLKIVGILDTLDSITEETNLLSLNASIEAARAGEHGKGFAVVATEIRNLSENSSRFTEEIHGILDSISHITSDLKIEITDGQRSVEQCTIYATEAGDAFKAISENAGMILERAKNIEAQSAVLEKTLDKTLHNAKEIGENVESTSASMQEVSSNLTNLNTRVNEIAEGYNEVNRIASELTKAARKE